MGIIIDFCVLAFILLSVYLGYRKGLITVGIKLCTFIIALVVTLVAYRPIANLIINTTYIDETIENSIIEKVNDKVASNEEESEITGELIESAKDGMLPNAARTLAINIVYGVVMLILFIGVKLILRFVNVLANAIAKLPILKQFNKIGGSLYGIIRGVFIVYIVLLLISLFSSIYPKNAAQQAIDETYLAKNMAKYNILNIFFKQDS